MNEQLQGDPRAATEQSEIVLHRQSPLKSIPRERVYFAFGSGRFQYDCKECGAKCCRGYGYGLGLDRTAEAHLALRPSLRFFSDPVVSSGLVHQSMRNCPPGCFFLDSENLCGVHAAVGYHSKPETCRLFPFNNLRLAGDYLIAAPHSALCPLEVVPPREHAPSSDHGELFASYVSQGIEADISSVLSPLGEVEELIALERSIVDLSESHTDALSFETFVAKQLAVTARWISGGHRQLAEYQLTVTHLQEQIFSILGADDSLRRDAGEELTRVLLASTPFIRSLVVFPSATGAGQSPAISLARVPQLLLALHSFAVLAEDAGMKRVTYQTVSRLFTDHLPLLLLLAHLDTQVNWKEGLIIDLTFEGGRDWQIRYLRIVKQLSKQLSTDTASLADVIRPHLPSDGVERVAFLKLLSKRLSGRVNTRDSQVAHPPPFRWRPFVQRWAIRTLDVDMLARYAGVLLLKKSRARSPSPAASGAQVTRPAVPRRISLPTYPGVVSDAHNLEEEKQSLANHEG